MNVSGIPISNLDPKLEVENFGDLFAKMLGVSKEVAEPALEVVQKAFDAAKEHWLNEACKWIDSHATDYAKLESIGWSVISGFNTNAFVHDFRKHMEL